MKVKEDLEKKGKYLPSGYALGCASGKFFKKIAAGYAPGYASGNLKKIFTLRPQATPQATLQAIFKKYLPSGYATGYF
ncbi:hypothetical protein T06_12921 [Trichinella sp. T6]|nr:hypothetical protein T06_13071 [Trichinella sp. T6]KRX77233.1 hypothetical protein T06_11005 [Trichinella sp. T6]KRX80682.1 hypothetical protein T06_12921 [Trichinella sp. T6]